MNTNLLVAARTRLSSVDALALATVGTALGLFAALATFHDVLAMSLTTAVVVAVSLALPLMMAAVVGSTAVAAVRETR